MKPESILPALWLAAAALIPVTALADDWLKEPPLKLTLKIGGKEVPMVVGEERRLEGEFKDPTVSIEASSVRSFDCGGIRFDYPAGYNWEAKRDGFVHSWTMEGPDVTLILQRFNAVTDARELADGVAKRHGAKAVKKEVTETHGGREFKGWKVAARLSGTLMHFHIFGLPLKQGTLLLQVIDKPADPETDSPEFTATMELLGKTLRTGGE